MKDRLISGFVAGLLAGIVMNIIDWAGYLMGLYTEQLLDWASVMVHGTLPATTFQVIWSQLSQLFFCSFLGIIFASLIHKISSNNLLVKGWLYGVFAWFSFYSLSVVFNLPFMAKHYVGATISHFISASAFGIVLALVLAYLITHTKASVK